MKELYFTLPYRRSTKTVRLEYGQVKKKFIVRTFDGEINGREESENPPKEEVFEDEQEMLKRVYEIKKGLMEVGGLSKIKSLFPNHHFSRLKLLMVQFLLNSQLILTLLN